MTENILIDRIAEAEDFYRDAADTKGRHVHHLPDRCKQTADLLKEAREAVESASSGSSFDADAPDYFDHFGLI